MKAFLIVNPRAAGGATGRHFDDISSAVRSAVGEHRHAFTERPMHASDLARRALREGADLVMGNRFKGRIEPDAMPPLHRYLGNPAIAGCSGQQGESSLQPQLGHMRSERCARCLQQSLQVARRDALPARHRFHGQPRVAEIFDDVG